jgi:hypothetical protein
MARKYQKYTPEFREEIATLVVEGQRANCSWLATSTYVVLSDQRPGAVGHHPAGLHTGQEHDDLAMPRTTATGTALRPRTSSLKDYSARCPAGDYSHNSTFVRLMAVPSA